MTDSNRDIFVTTKWTMVLRASGADQAMAHTALEDLCQAYWPPLYAYVRRRGFSPHDSEDLTQGFFARTLKLDSFAQVDRRKGKFRAFLLASMKHFLADEWDKASAQKRDVHCTISLDAKMAEKRYLSEPADKLTPENVFERQWAMTLLEQVVRRLNTEYDSKGQSAFFNEARFAITGDKNTLPYADMAKGLGLSEEAIRTAIHRLRQRYRRILREEIARTVEEESEITEELNCLRRILSS